MCSAKPTVHIHTHTHTHTPCTIFLKTFIGILYYPARSTKPLLLGLIIFSNCLEVIVVNVNVLNEKYLCVLYSIYKYI